MAANNYVIDKDDPYNARFYEPNNSEDEQEWRTIWTWPNSRWHWNMRYEPPFDETFLKDELTQKGLKTICRIWGLNPIGNKPELVRTITRSPQNRNLLRAKRIADEEKANASNRDNMSQRMSGPRGSLVPQDEEQGNQDRNEVGDENENDDNTGSTNSAQTLSGSPQRQRPDKHVTFAQRHNKGSIDGSQGSQQPNYRYDGNHNIPQPQNINDNNTQQQGRQNAQRNTVHRDGVNRAIQNAQNIQQQQGNMQPAITQNRGTMPGLFSGYIDTEGLDATVQDNNENDDDDDIDGRDGGGRPPNRNVDPVDAQMQTDQLQQALLGYNQFAEMTKMRIHITGAYAEDVLKKLADIEYYQKATKMTSHKLWQYITVSVLKQRAKTMYMSQYHQNPRTINTLTKLLAWIYDKLGGNRVVDARKQKWKDMKQGYNEPPKHWYMRYDEAVKNYQFAVTTANVYEVHINGDVKFKQLSKEKMYERFINCSNQHTQKLVRRHFILNQLDEGYKDTDIQNA